MISLLPQTVDGLTGIYAVANTPSYLYRHFRKEKAVQELAQTHTVEELKDFIIEVDIKHELTLKDVVLAYAATVAVTFCELRTVRAAVKDLRTQKLQWVEPIIRMWEETYVGSQVITSQCLPTARIGRPQTICSEAGTQRSQTRCRPELRIDHGKFPESDVAVTRVEFGKEEQ